MILGTTIQPAVLRPVALEEGAEPVVDLLLGLAITTLVEVVGRIGLPDAVRRPVLGLPVGMIMVPLRMMGLVMPGAIEVGAAIARVNNCLSRKGLEIANNLEF